MECTSLNTPQLQFFPRMVWTQDQERRILAGEIMSDAESASRVMAYDVLDTTESAIVAVLVPGYGIEDCKVFDLLWNGYDFIDDDYKAEVDGQIDAFRNTVEV